MIRSWKGLNSESTEVSESQFRKGTFENTQLIVITIIITIIMLVYIIRGDPTPVLLPGKSHGWRSLVGCSPWGREESDTTQRLPFHFLLSCIGEGNGNPLQCSCLENPGDEGAWWAAVYGVTQCRTRLKWLSSSKNLFFRNLPCAVI